MIRLHMSCVLVCGLFCGTVVTLAAERGGLRLEVKDGAGICPVHAAVQAWHVPGRFSVRDAKTKKEIALPQGWLEDAGPKTLVRCEAPGDLRLTAEIVASDDRWLVSGQVESLKPRERGLVLEYHVPLSGEKLVFGNGLNQAVTVGDQEQEGNIIPIAALDDSLRAIALAIPPTAPCEFGMVGSTAGLGVRFYLGLSPLTAAFPNRAAFSFLVYPAQPGWGFRSALARYYDFFPDYYQVRTKQFGLLMFGVFATELPDMDLYAVNRIGISRSAARTHGDLDRDKKYGLISSYAVDVGNKELSRLAKMPANLDEADRLFQEACRAAAAGEGPPAAEPAEGQPAASKLSPARQAAVNRAAAAQRAALCELIQNSACRLSTGNRAMVLRYTGWGGHTISFKTNPNPALFDGAKNSVGLDTLNAIKAIIDQYPDVNSVGVDSLGSNWPALLNYCPEHFRYAKYPLTVDPDGRPALHNELSHCEFLDELRAYLRGREGFLWGNGIYSYPSRRTLEPEHYRGRDVPLGRFFIAARLDVGSSEGGNKSTQDRYEFIRAAMGRKLYELTNSYWEEPSEVEDWFNKCLLYALAGTNVRRYDMDVTKIKPYHPEFYDRDRKLTRWFIETGRRLDQAGWEPVTYAAPSSEKILVERYGHGREMYFVLLSEGSEAVEAALRLQLAPLELKAGRFAAEEIARGTAVKVAGETLSLRLEPKRTCIVRLTPKT